MAQRGGWAKSFWSTAKKNPGALEVNLEQGNAQGRVKKENREGGQNEGINRKNMAPISFVDK